MHINTKTYYYITETGEGSVSAKSKREAARKLQGNIKLWGVRRDRFGFNYSLKPTLKSIMEALS